MFKSVSVNGSAVIGGCLLKRTSFAPLCIPIFNTSRAETIASSARIKEIKDIDTLPEFPNYLE